MADLKNLLNLQIIKSRVTTKDQALLSRQLSTMIQAGVPILDALRSLARQADKPVVASTLDNIASDIEGGKSLSESLEAQDRTFSTFYVGVVRAGEASGRLSEALATLSDYQEQNYLFIRKVRSSLTYPFFVLVLVLIVVFLMFVYLVPQLTSIFDTAEVSLPIPTQIIVFIANFLSTFWWVVVLLVIALTYLGRSYLRTPEGQFTLATWLLKIPVVKQLTSRFYLTRLTSILNTLFLSDVPVIESLEIARSSIGNAVYQNLLRETAQSVKDGSNISDLWAGEPQIPPMLTTMIAVGERSGDVAKSFAEANRFFQRDVEEILQTITVFIEPALVIVLGLGVGLIVAGVLLPIYNLVLVL